MTIQRVLTGFIAAIILAMAWSQQHRRKIVEY